MAARNPQPATYATEYTANPASVIQPASNTAVPAARDIVREEYRRKTPRAANAARQKTPTYNPSPTSPSLEPHLSPVELARLWAVSPDYIRRRFRYEPGVTMLGRSLRIPQSVAERVHRQSGARATAGPVKFARRQVRTAKDGRLEPVLTGYR